MGDLSEHFSASEFRCSCGCGGLILDPALLPALEEFRELCTRIAGQDCPAILRSGYRCARHNAAIGGKPDSQHLFGKAADVKTPLLHIWKMKDAGLATPAFRNGGIGLYPNFIHLDVRQGSARWGVFFGGSCTWEAALRYAENYYQQGRLMP